MYRFYLICTLIYMKYSIPINTKIMYAGTFSHRISHLFTCICEKYIRKEHLLKRNYPQLFSDVDILVKYH